MGMWRAARGSVRVAGMRGSRGVVHGALLHSRARARVLWSCWLLDAPSPPPPIGVPRALGRPGYEGVPS
eukprot:scaffold16523_cov117-Isochrysis_galbana.AAC.3